MATINLQIPGDLRNKFKSYCAEQGHSMTWLILKLIRDEMGKQTTTDARPVLGEWPELDPAEQIVEPPPPKPKPVSPEPFDNSKLSKAYQARKGKK